MSQKTVGLKAAFGQDFIDNTNIKIELIYLKNTALVLLLVHFIANKINVGIRYLSSKCKNLFHL